MEVYKTATEQSLRRAVVLVVAVVLTHRLVLAELLVREMLVV